METVLVVDDDRKLIDMLRRTLSYEGYRVITATDGHTALCAATSERPDVVVLDWLLPGMDGIQLHSRLRPHADTPVLMLTAKSDIDDRVRGLDSGADDYLVKPFAPAELLARVRALLRRGDVSAEDRQAAFSDLTLDVSGREARRGTRSFRLTPTEFRLLEFFLRHPRQVVPRDLILQGVWGPDFERTDNVLEVYVGYLRAKIEAGGASRLIHTVRGVGYVLRHE